MIRFLAADATFVTGPQALSTVVALQGSSRSLQSLINP